MKKLSVHLSLLCLLALLLVPFAGCKKEDEATDETPAATTESTMETSTTETTTTTTGTMSTDTGTGMGTDTGMTSEPMGTDATTPPAGK
ncbi:MAG: hypothetical protein QOF89_2921 [Acidobacteriota bacterium]|jgi:hypothetical protein|nr:hypothetical protein [Acidobacteriota bacterium]